MLGGRIRPGGRQSTGHRRFASAASPPNGTDVTTNLPRRHPRERSEPRWRVQGQTASAVSPAEQPRTRAQRAPLAGPGADASGASHLGGEYDHAVGDVDDPVGEEADHQREAGLRCRWRCRRAPGSARARASSPDSAGGAHMLTMIRRYKNAAITGGDHGDDGQRVAVLVDAGLDHAELGDEAGRQRHAGLGEQEHRQRQRRATACGWPSPRNDVEVGRAVAGAADERRRRRTCRSPAPSTAAGTAATTDMPSPLSSWPATWAAASTPTRMKPAWLIERVGEHPLDVGLHDGQHRADHQRQHGEHPDRRAPVVAPVRQGDDEHPQQGGERGGLADRRHERR